MGRIQKCRAWHKIEKRMIYPEEITDRKGDLWAIGFHGLPIAVDRGSFQEDDIIGWNIDHYLEAIWFTGLRDIKGKDIYDGDIVKDRWGILWKVQWNEEKACFELLWHGGPQPEYSVVGMYMIKDCQCAITGNIWESESVRPQ